MQESLDIAASDLADLIQSVNPTEQALSAPADQTPDDELLLNEISFEDSKMEELTAKERQQFGKLSELYPVALLRTYWEKNKLESLFPWQLDCLT